MTVEARIQYSAILFRDLVWPQIGPLIGGGELVPVESVTDSEFAQRLDRQAGIDAWVFRAETHMVGVASRVQWTSRAWNTFTIRMRTDYGGHLTEYQKRCVALATPGAITPHWTVQAYVDHDGPSLVSAGAALTSDVIGAVGNKIGFERPNGHGGRMHVLGWDELTAAGVNVVTVGAALCPG